MHMTVEEAISVLEDGMSAMSQCLQSDAMERLRAMARESLIGAGSDSPDTRELARAMAPFQELVLPPAREAVSRRTVISIPLPLCNAVARRFKGEECIFLFDGLLDAAVASVAMSFAVQSLPAKFDAGIPNPGYPDISAKGWLSVIFSCLINRFIEHAEPLPDFRVLIPHPGREVEIRHAMIGTAWWMLLHEVGHFVLGHMSSGDAPSRSTVLGALLVNQELSVRQQEEFEADAFVLSCLTETGRELAYGWANYALGPQMMLENLISQGSDTHPLSINRIDRLLSLIGPKLIADELQAKAHLRRHGKARDGIHAGHAEIRRDGGDPVFVGWSSDALLKAMEGMRALFDDAQLPLDLFVASRGFRWRDAIVGTQVV